MENFDEVREKIREIEDTAVGGGYIFRGEAKDFGLVSSGFYREYIMGTSLRFFPVEDGVIDKLSGEVVSKVSSWEKNRQLSPPQLISEIQHYGGITNVIDATTDILIALFFACDSSDYDDQDGRIILLNLAHLREMGENFWPARGPSDRSVVQKSVFVQPKNGYIDPKDLKDAPILVPKNLKRPILNYLGVFHGLTEEYVYSGILGFIKRQESHKKEVVENFLYNTAIPYYTEVSNYDLRGKAYMELGKFNEALSDLTKSIEINPIAESYYNRAYAYITRSLKGGIITPREREWLKLAIADLSEAIQRNQNWAEAYVNRGLCYMMMGNSEEARQDFIRANKINPKSLSPQFQSALRGMNLSI